MGTMLACFVIMPVVACYAFISRQYFGTSIAAGQALIGAATLLPTIIGGIVLSAAAAFTITTGDSYLLSAAANFCIDLYSKINPNATEKEELKVSRAFILIAGIVAYVILTFFHRFWQFSTGPIQYMERELHQQFVERLYGKKLQKREVFHP